MPRRIHGWLPDYPDFRDYSAGEAKVATLLAKTGPATEEGNKLPAAVDLRQWCPPVEDQGDLGSCTACAAVALVEYFERRAFGKHVDGSRLFLYKTSRNLLKLTGDTGSTNRATLGALVLFGLPPEEYWPYEIADFDLEPPAFCYAFAQNYQAISYYRLDLPDTTGAGLLKSVKSTLASNLPALFGFTVYTSIEQAVTTGRIPFPSPGERVLGGHAMAAVGYDDRLKIKNTAPGSKATTGALLVRNSWGASWGESGYGWLPYEYILRGLAVDWWSLVKSEWVETGQFLDAQ